MDQLANQQDVLKYETLEKVLINGDLKTLTSAERVSYYNRTCESLGLNPLTKPFEYITLNGKLTLYARRDATEQLRKNNGVSIVITNREKVDDLFIVTARATDAKGRTDESVGAVNIGGLKGDNLANAIMKAESKAKRRVTLSIAGLGWTDETEVETIPDAKIIKVDHETGEIKETLPEAQNKPTEKTKQEVRVILSTAQINRFYAIVKAKKVTEEMATVLLENLMPDIFTDGKIDWSKVNRKDYDTVCKLFESGEWETAYNAMINKPEPEQTPDVIDLSTLDFTKLGEGQ
jgi:hypothetical protein